MKDTNKLIKNVLRALPAIPFIAPRKTSSVLPFVLGAFGAAVVGGIAAVMIFSPRTRYRALDIARDGYGKALAQVDQLGLGQKLGLSSDDRKTTVGGHSNGLTSEKPGASYSATGV